MGLACARGTGVCTGGILATCTRIRTTTHVTVVVRATYGQRAHDGSLAVRATIVLYIVTYTAIT